MSLEWPSCTFSELFDLPLRNGLTRPKSVRGQGVKMVNMGELFSNSHIGDIDMERVPLSDSEAEKYLLNPGDLLFARQSLVREGAGKCSIFIGATEPVTWEGHIIRARLNQEIADPNFYYYFFSSPLGFNTIQTIVEQVAAAGIRGSDLAKLHVPLPPLPEQRAIAHILGTLDDKIELNRAMNQTLEEMARALFKSWFVDFDPVHAKARGEQPPGLDPAIVELFPSTFVETELGLVPEGWRVDEVGKIVTAVGGGTPSTKNPAYWEGGSHHFVTPKDLSGLKSPILIETERLVTDAGVAKISSGLLPIRTVLMSSRAPVGYLALSEIPVCVNQGFIAMICDGPVSSYYMLNWAHANMEIIKANAGGTTFAEISKKNFRPILAIVPSHGAMSAFTNVVAPMYQNIAANEHESHTLAELRDTLLPKLMSGELRVPEAVEMMEDVAL